MLAAFFQFRRITGAEINFNVDGWVVELTRFRSNLGEWVMVWIRKDWGKLFFMWLSTLHLNRIYSREQIIFFRYNKSWFFEFSIRTYNFFWWYLKSKIANQTFISFLSIIGNNKGARFSKLLHILDFFLTSTLFENNLCE